MAFMNRSYAWGFGVFCIFGLLVLWQIPGTIALRNIFLGLLLIAAIASFVIRRPSPKLLPLAPMGVLSGLTLWMMAVIGFWGSEPALSWREFLGQWCVPLVCFGCGIILAANSVQSNRAPVLLKTVFIALFLQILLHDLLDIWFYIGHGEFPYRAAPVLRLPEALMASDGRGVAEILFHEGFMDKFSYLNNTFAALLIAETVQRLMARSRMLPISNALVGAALAAIVFCSYTLRTRNGNVGLLVLLVMAGIFVAIRATNPSNRKKVLVGMTGFFIAVAMTGVWFFKSDPRWQTLIETVPIALDTRTHTAWRHAEAFPRLANGQEVDASNYERVAWAKEGTMLVIDHPLGTGYNRNAFGDGIDRKYDLGGAYRGGHSHSGIVDFAIANGLPGLLLWLSFLGSLTWVGWCAFKGQSVASGLMLMFLISGFFGRSLVDSNLRDHILQQFMVLAGIFGVIAQAARPTSTGD